MDRNSIAIISCCTVLAINPSYAGQLQSANNTITGLDEAISAAKTTSHLSVVFPAEVPTSANKLYASENSRKDFWAIQIDSTSTCHGAHFCNIGTITGKAKGTINEMYMDMKSKKQIQKESVMLADGTSAYFTPGHAEADWHNPSLEWQFKDISYSLTWAITNDDAQKILITMANSAMHPGSG